MGQTDDPGHTLAVIRSAFGCGEALAGTIAALSRADAHARGTMLWPLPDRDETTLLTRGAAREVAYGRDGSVMVLLPIAPGDFYGDLVGSDASHAQVESTSEGAGAHFASGAVVRLMESYSCVGVAITRHLSGRLATMRRRMVEAAMLSATGRIAAELLRQAGTSADQTIRPMPVFADFAVSVQSTRETVSRTVSQLEKRGVLKRVAGGLQIAAPHRLEELVY
jgi:CRP/FNR family transcriptional regulator, cyclic AMP receptor protein